GVEEARFLRRALERAHGAGEARPVQDLLLAAVLDRLGGQAAPGLPVSPSPRLEHPPVGPRGGAEVVSLWGPGRGAPAGRGDQRHAIGRLGQDARRRRAEIEQALRRGRRWIEILVRDLAIEYRQSAALRQHLAAVAVDGEGHDRVAEAGAVVVEIEDGV